MNEHIVSGNGSGHKLPSPQRKTIRFPALDGAPAVSVSQKTWRDPEQDVVSSIDVTMIRKF